MKNSTVPKLLRTYPDVRRALWKRHTLPFLLWLGWVALLSVISLLWVYPQIADTTSMIVAPTIWLVLSILPFFVFRIPQKLFDRSFAGTILTAEPIVTYKFPVIYLPGTRVGKWEPSMNLTVRTTNGNVSLISPKLKDPADPYPYKAGQQIVHLRGSDYPIILTGVGENSGICPVCGAKSAKESQKCNYCRLSLIQFGNIPSEASVEIA